MDIHEDWPQIKSLFRATFGSSFHYAVATVSGTGEPHVAPIGSLILGEPGRGIWFEKFPRRLPRHLGADGRVCVMAVDSGRWFWLRSLLRGRFARPPAVRLYGVAGELRDATDREVELWRKRVRPVGFTRGHALMWRSMARVRDIEFTRVETVHIGEMTRGD